MIVGTAGSNTKNGVNQGWLMGISLKPDNRGSQLWKTTFTPPFVDLDKNITLAGMFTGGFSMNGVYPEDGVFTFGETKQLKTWVYDLGSGQEIWSTNETYSAENQYNFYGQSQIVIDGKLILYGGYAGKMTAFDIQTGKVEWIHNWQSIGDESPYGNYPIQISAVSGDKIYTTTWEHSYTIPLYRGPNLTCLNATDGTVIWDILDFGGGGSNFRWTSSRWQQHGQPNLLLWHGSKRNHS
jgi:outer membrane protein assembly factor BamB